MGQSHLCTTHRAWCCVLHSATLWCLDQEPHGFFLGPTDGLYSSCLLQQGPEKQTNKAPAMSTFSSGQRAFFGLRDGRVVAGPPFPEPLHRDKKMQPWDPGLRGAVVVSRKQEEALGWAWISCQNERNIHCNPACCHPAAQWGRLAGAEGFLTSRAVGC